MAKLTEKQVNILSIVGGILVFALFAYLSYADYEEIDQIKLQQDAVQQEINQAMTKKVQLTNLKSQLYVLKENYEFVKQMLPDDREMLKFYETLDQFRLSKQMEAWLNFSHNEGDITTKELQKKKGAQAPQPSIILTTSYSAVIPATFNQLGELLTAIENYPRFYGVTNITIPGMISSPTEPDPSAIINLTLVSFTYPEKTPFDEKEIKRLLSDFKVTNKEQKQIQEIKDKWKKTPFQWSPLSRNPFDKDKVLIPIKDKDVGTDIAERLKEMGPTSVEDAQKSIDELEKLRNQHLLPFAVAGLWVELQNKLMEQKYEEKLNSLMLPAEMQTQHVQKVEEMKRELREWKSQIKQVALEQKALQFLAFSEKKIKEMEAFYQEGKEKGSKEIIDSAIKVYNELLPQLREYEPLENKIPQLQAHRKRAEELFTKADTQLKIIDEVAKLELQGIIYWANKPQHSVAFINKKVVRKDDMVAGGFVVHDIKDGEVVLRFKEETVPIRLKRVIKTSALIKKSS